MRRVSQQGSVKMRGLRTFISEIFAYEWLGLRALDERYFEVLYGPVRLGFLDTTEHTVSPRAACRAAASAGSGAAGTPWK